jgi:uncharacterized protein
MTPIRHEPNARRFVTEVDSEVAFISYRELPNRVLDLHHTFVPAAVRGSGIASRLTAHALHHAREHGYAVVPSCPFVAIYIERHAEYRDLLA